MKSWFIPLDHSAPAGLIDPASKDNARDRQCLSCRDTFASLWSGERICKHCKQSSAWRAGIAYKPARERS